MRSAMHVMLDGGLKLDVSLFASQDIDNFDIEHKIMAAIQNDPQAMALIDEVCGCLPGLL